jgi:hypothetical protein
VIEFHAITYECVMPMLKNPWVVLCLVTLLSVLSVRVSVGNIASAHQLGAGAAFGIATGSIYAIECASKSSILMRRIMSSIIGLLCGVIFAYLLAPDKYLYFALGGGAIGFFARTWIYYLMFI